jgi:ribonuclease-3
MFQAAGVEQPPYEIERQGPDHAIEFSATLTYEGKVIGQGAGRSKKLAETEAAISALANTDLVLPKRKKAK